jgi:cell division septation protein DedD
MAVYKNSEARKASQQLKPAKKTAIAIKSGSAKTIPTKPKAVIKNNQSMTKSVAKKATPSPSPKKTLGPLPKNPTLNDYLARGLKPPVKKGTKLPSDADVRIKGYNA